MKNCINLKIKMNKNFECKKNKKIITLSECNGCPFREYKKAKPIKKRTSKQSKLEKNRFSIITDDLEHCFLCGKRKEHLHEVFFGRNRANSIKYGLVIPLCLNCHHKAHFDPLTGPYLKQLAQKRFNEVYDEDFVDIFKINYL